MIQTQLRLKSCRGREPELSSLRDAALLILCSRTSGRNRHPGAYLSGGEGGCNRLGQLAQAGLEGGLLLACKALDGLQALRLLRHLRLGRGKALQGCARS